MLDSHPSSTGHHFVAAFTSTKDISVHYYINLINPIQENAFFLTLTLTLSLN